MEKLLALLDRELQGFDLSSRKLWLKHSVPEAKGCPPASSMTEVEAGVLAPVLNSLADGLLVTDASGRLQIFNQAAVRLLGGEVLEIGSPAWREEFILCYADKVTRLECEKAPLFRTQRGEEVNGLVLYMRTPARPDGFYVEMNGRPIRDDSYKIYGSVFLIKDVTERQLLEEKLRRFETFVESTRDSIISVDRDGTVLSWNSGAEAIWGYPATEVVGRNLGELLGAEIFEQDKKLVQDRLLRGESVKNHDRWVRRKNGEEIFLVSSLSPIRDEKGEFSTVVAFGKDCTEKKLFFEGVARDRDRFQTLSHLVNDMVWEWDQARDITWRHGNENAFGYAQELVYNGQNWWMERIHPEDKAKILAVFRSVMEDRQLAWRSEYRFRRADGSYAHVIDRGRVLAVDENARPTHLMGAMFDITERKAAEEKAAHLAAIVEFSEDAIIRGGLDGKVEAWNRGAEKLFGYSAEEMVGADGLTILVPDDQRPKLLAVIERVGRGESVGRQEGWRIRRDGKRILVAETLSPMFGEGGRVIGICVVSRDITEIRRNEEKVHQLAANLARSNEELRRFAHMVSHDLREPLRSISSFAALFKNDYGHQLDERAESYLEFIVSGSLRMHRLIEGLLNYSQSESVPLQQKELDTEQLLKAVRDDLKIALEESRAELRVEALPNVWADEVMLRQLFQNLISNAIKFRGPNPPRISIAATEGDDEWVISVRDNGIGIPPEFQKDIFTIFRRLHGPTEYPGTGLGLATCAKIVEKHGGRIWVNSRPDEGAIFSFALPRPAPRMRVRS